MALTKHKSVSVSKVPRDNVKRDQRVVRTRKQVDAAFVDLLHRRAYGNIRVSDITKKAGAGRATFYAHYSSKDDLLRSQFNRIVVPMLVINLDAPCPLDATALFDHIQSAPRIYKGLVGGPDSGSGPRVLRECFEERIRESIRLQEAKSRACGLALGIDEAIVTRFLASSLLVVLEGALEGSAQRSPQEAQAIFAKLAGGALAASRAPISGNDQ